VSVENTPSQPGDISGPDLVSLGQVVTYTLPNVDGVTYTWIYSGSGVELSPFGNQITIAFGPSATGGTLSVTLTNDCGTSLPSILLISIEILPPSKIEAKRIANKFATQIDYVNVVKWSASPSPGIEFYRIYRNGRFIREVKASRHLFKDHNRPKCKRDVYSVTSIGTNGQESLHITISI
jgi:hypothetical protein